jgi:hypothetical protein
MRMLMRRFTRLTNAFSKKVENHACAVALHAMYYNFVRIHQTLKITPAMAAGVTSRLWEMNETRTHLGLGKDKDDNHDQRASYWSGRGSIDAQHRRGGYRA